MKKLSFLLALAAPLSGQAAETGELVRFISCPVYRDADSGKKSGCWLADNRENGTRYDVSLSPHKPDWNRAVLVEGRTTTAPETACGAPVLNPVRTSVLSEPCQRHVLPAEGYPGRKFVLPKRNVDPVAVPRKVSEGPFTEQTFSLFFEFDRSFVVYQYSDYLLDKAVTWLAAAKPKKVVVTGFAASDAETVSGRTIAERAEVAAERAAIITESLHRIFPDLAIETRTETGAKVVELPDADGLPGQSQRRVDIRAVF